MNEDTKARIEILFMRLQAYGLSQFDCVDEIKKPPTATEYIQFSNRILKKLEELLYSPNVK